MKKIYVAPQIEVIEIEIESILCGSPVQLESASSGDPTSDDSSTKQATFSL